MLGFQLPSCPRVRCHQVAVVFSDPTSAPRSETTPRARGPGRPALASNTDPYLSPKSHPHLRPLLPSSKMLMTSGPKMGRTEGRWLGHPCQGSQLNCREPSGHLCAPFIHSPILKQVLSTHWVPH